MPTAPEGIVHRLSMLAAPWTSQSARRVRRRTARSSCRQLAQIGPPLLLKKIHVRAADAVLHPAPAGLGAQGQDQPQTAAGARENPDDLRPPLDLLVRTLKHVRRTHPKMMLPGKQQERERLLDPIAKLRLRLLPVRQPRGQVRASSTLGRSSCYYFCISTMILVPVGELDEGRQGGTDGPRDSKPATLKGRSPSNWRTEKGRKRRSSPAISRWTNAKGNYRSSRVAAVETVQPAQKSRERLVESRSQRPARRQMLLQEQPLARFPRLEGLQRQAGRPRIMRGIRRAEFSS